MTVLTPLDDCHASLRLLGTTDVHVHLLAYDYYTGRADPHLGLAKTATLIAQARQEVPNCLLLDNGDFLQGNPLGDFIIQTFDAGGSAAGEFHPSIRVMNRIGYDAATVGNHEFNYGLDVLFRSLQGAAFPIVSANIARALADTPLQDQTLFQPYTLLDRMIRCDDGKDRALRVGVIGFAPPQIVQWDSQILNGAIATRGIVEAAAAWVPQIRAAGADLVVALAHSGIGAPDDQGPSENATAALARVPGIDAIIAGHSHLVFPSENFADHPGVCIASGRVQGVPTVMPGFNGSHLGVIDLRLEHRAGCWQVADSTVEARPITALTPSTQVVVTEARPEHEGAIAFSRRPVGHSRIPLHSYFSTIAASAALRVVAEAQAAHVARQIAGRPEAALPILSAVSPFKAGGRGGPANYTDIPAGNIMLRHVADLYVFPNTIAALRLTGAELAEWLEISAGLYHHIPPGARDAALIDPDFPGYNHDRILGLTYEIDLGQPARHDRHGLLRYPAARRVADLRHNGQPVAPDQEFLLATNSYRAAGCGGYVQARPDRQVDVGRESIRDVLIRHLTNGVPEDCPLLPCLRFRPMPGTSVIFTSSPEAARHLDAIAHLRPEPLGLDPAGFARFRLHP